MDANEAYLNDFMVEVDAETHAENWKVNYVKKLLAKGGDLYPWTHANILEALENRKTSDELFLTSCIITGVETTVLGARQFIGTAVKTVIYEYWKDVAKKKADEDYGK